MKNIQPAVTDDEILSEVWRIKDETAKRYQNADEYVQALHAKTAQVPNSEIKQPLRN